MSRNQRAVFPPSGQADQPRVKPDAPDDLWEKMDSLVSFPADPGFTIREFADRYGIHFDVAKRRIYQLEKEGKLTRGRCMRGNHEYAVFNPR